MKTITSILILCCAPLLFAEEPELIDIDATYFHPAASYYIHGDSTSASNLVTTGLSLFPENGKLLRLKDLLDQEQEKKNEEQNQDEQNQDQKKDSEQDDPQDQQDQQDPEEPQQDPQNQDDSNQEQAPEPPRAEQMSKDEAESLLDAMKQEEENKRLQLHPVMGAPVKVDKDW